jgi:hypothetical protein
MATKAQIRMKAMNDIAKRRKQDINYKYARFIPELQQSGNVESSIKRVEEALLMIVRKRRKIQVGTKQPCRSYTPLNWMDGDLAKMGNR